MKETSISAIVTVSIVLIISALAKDGRSTMFDASGGVGAYSFWLGMISLAIGIIMSIISDTRKYGQGILIGSGILILIGITFCSGGLGIGK